MNDGADIYFSCEGGKGNGGNDSKSSSEGTPLWLNAGGGRGGGGGDSSSSIGILLLLNDDDCGGGPGGEIFHRYIRAIE